MKILLLYFSGTGNTERITALYKSAFAELGHEATALSLPCDAEYAREDFINGFDMIGFGYPIHAFNAPEIMLKACKALPKLPKSRKKPVFVYKTSGEPVRMSDVSSLKMKGILKRRGYTLFAEYQYVMPYNIIFRHNDKAVYKMWETAKALVPIDVADIVKKTPHLPKYVAFGAFVSWVLRIEHGGARLIGRGFKSTDACTKCGLCIKNCPAKNIELDKNGKVVFGKKCMICMRCTMYCPHDAIKPGILNGWKVNGKYSFAPPDKDPPPDKHDKYCKKAYDRYYANAEKRIKEHDDNTE